MAGHSTGMLSTFTGYRTLMCVMSKATKSAKQAGGPMVDVRRQGRSPTTPPCRRRSHREGRRRRPRRCSMASHQAGAVPQDADEGRSRRPTGDLAHGLPPRHHPHPRPLPYRVDIARAHWSRVELTPEHDGRLIADVVAEWARRHDKPFSLTLTGPAGKEYISGESGEHITIDAVEFCRILSGRATGTGLLDQKVPF